VVEPFTNLDPARIATRLGEVREACGPRVEILIAGKYVPIGEMGTLVEAGIKLIGENRLQDLEAKRGEWGDSFEWDFIGALQSRKVPRVAEQCQRIHSVATESALGRLAAAVQSGKAAPGRPRVLLQVNVSGEPSKAGFEPDRLDEMLEAAPLPVAGLMTMPPLTAEPEASRPYFARLAELAAEHDLAELSMGTSQDWRVAVAEGATVIRLGAGLLG